MLELEEEESFPEVHRHRTRKDRRSPFTEELEPWSRTAKIRSQQTSIDPSTAQLKADRPIAVNRFLATVHTSAHSRADKKRSKMSLRDQPTFCFDQVTSKEICPEDNDSQVYIGTVKMKEEKPTESPILTQGSVAEGRKSTIKQRPFQESSQLAKNTLTLNAEFQRHPITTEQDIRFRSNLQKLLKLRQNVRKKKLSLADHTTDRPPPDLRQTRTRFTVTTQTKLHQIPLTTLDQLELTQPSYSESKHRQPNKNCFLMTYKFIKQKSRERQQKLHRNNMDNKLSDINRLINCIRQHGVEYSQLLGNPRQQLRQRLPSRDRHNPY